MTTTITAKPLRLTRRDIDVLRSLALYKRLSTQQIGRLHFPDAHERTVNNRMLDLRGTHRDKSEQYVSRRILVSQSDREYEHGGRKTAVYFLTPTNVRNILNHLSKRGLLERAGELEDLPTVETGTTSHKHLTHELGISEWFITLDEAAHDSGPYTNPAITHGFIRLNVYAEALGDACSNALPRLATIVETETFQDHLERKGFTFGDLRGEDTVTVVAVPKLDRLQFLIPLASRVMRVPSQ